MQGVEYKKGKRGLLVTEMPGKKKPCLCVVKDNHISKVATFNNNDDVEAFKMYMDFLLGVSDDNNDI